MMNIREALASELADVLMVEQLAFGQDDEAKLVEALLEDPSAKPIVSLLAFKKNQAVGHILFTKVYIAESENAASLLAPLAIVPEAQKQGIGGRLIDHGLQKLSQAGVELVFVLGYPKYYSRFGFKPAGALGFEAPYPIPEQNADAWMVQALQPNIIGSVRGKVVCAEVLNQPEYWRE
ncbi:gcn5-related n-acetyltransferase [Leptolyngbya sp. Heron Island J]|uniref:GNAT family N-acetyltransferase n=1 Tax=Leptolyngbya sp. Heron Island J TaxID=1385935 RepID=UPI0003B9C209|nr:N-acetyltransferase [Leptolyngbya sp. Heron Island J]ESA33803.1 gcn5-related n-acetyltransferase [Leptolyngbya sp. Heron Island J]